jgi:serine/threonine protein kinase
VIESTCPQRCFGVSLSWLPISSGKSYVCNDESKLISSFGLVLLEVATNICVPDGGPAWQALRSNDFGVIDLSPLSPALADLITSCMDMEPTYRPTIEHIVSHPVIQRARTTVPALAPQEKGWLASILAGPSGFGAQVQQPLPTGRYTADGDLIME